MTDQNEDRKELPQKALKQIRALCAGNGAEADSIQIKGATGTVIECMAINHIELHTDTIEEQKIGHVVVGDMVENPQSIIEAVKGITGVALKNEETRKFITKILLDRPDKGFALHAKFFDIEPLNRSFSYLEPCGSCQGQGRTACRTCGGRRQETCNKCHGRTMTPCTYCHSSGYIQSADGKQIQCNRCFGQRQMACNICRKTGVISCRQCKGDGAVKCNNCKGAAVTTRITHLRVKMKTLFEIDRAELPDAVTKVIETQGPKMVAKGHIKLHAEPVKREDGGLAIQYQAVFPYGDLELTINGKPLKTHLFGYRGKMLRLPNFLDQLIAGNVEHLQDAASGQGDVSSKIRKASRSKLIAKGLVYSLTMPSKKALMALKKKYPMGVSNELLKDIIISSNKGLANVTRKTRMGGIMVGALATALISAAYFMTSLRTSLAPILGQENIIIIVDFLLIPVGGFVGASVSKFMGKRPLQKALGPLMPKKIGSQSSTWQSYVTSAFIFFIVIYVAKIMGNSVPTWFPL